jgi:tetratricopeptide (TPR) repeat protein
VKVNFQFQLPKAPPKARFAMVAIMALLLVSFIFSTWSDFPFNGNPLQWITAKETYMDALEQRHRYLLSGAAKNFQKAVKIYPKDANFQYGLAEVLEQRELYDEAEEHFQEAVRLRPNFTEAWLHLANVQYQQKKTAEAENSTKQALKVSPDDAEAQCQMATLLNAAGKTEEAVKLFDRAKRGEHASARYWFLAARYEQSLGHDDQALADYKKAAAMDRGAPEYAESYGMMLVHVKKPKEAVYWLQSAVKLNDDNADAWELLGLGLYLAGDLDHAEGALLAASNRAPDNLLYKKRYAVLLHERQHYKIAEQVFRKMIDKGTDDLSVWNMYMDCLQHDSFGEARGKFEQILAAGNQRTKALALTYIADLQRIQGGGNESYDTYEKALSFDPPDEIKVYLQARLAERTKQRDIAQSLKKVPPDVLKQLKDHVDPLVLKKLEEMNLKP